MLYIKVNEDGYVIDWADQPQSEDFLEVPSPDNPIDFLMSWANFQLVDGQLRKDETAAADAARRKEVEAQVKELRQQLNDSADQVMEQLENLFSATTLAGFLTSLLDGARNLKTVLQERSTIRQRIAELLNNQ